ncbi:MAG TPA: hypothetical protein VGY75_12405 [Candidatus Udaeobacter sp.]|jgi:hypothetical protein|nr:hypothetical protein [Candidatus Udaeobacter sp.]
MNDGTDGYLGYLSKEMNIMGILSTFCVAVPALVLERLASAAKDTDLATIWTSGKTYFWIASALLLVSASLFYKQRSLLAFYYGRIALGEPPLPHVSVPDYKTWTDWADSWTTWIPYHAAFWVGVVAILEYVFALVSYKRASIQEHVCGYILLPTLVLAIGLIVMAIVHKDRPIRFSDNAWIVGINRMFKKTP